MKNLSEIRIWLYTFTSTFSQLYTPIIFLFFADKGVNVGEVGLLFALGSGINLLTEVPFGVFSDKYSKKLSVIIGSIFTILGLTIYINGFGFMQMAFAIGLISVGESGKSGSVEAILSETLKEPKYFFQINNYTTYLSNAISAVIIGSLFSINHTYPFYVALFCEFILFFLIISVKTKKNIPNQLNSSVANEEILNFKVVFSIILKYKSIFFILFFSYFFIPQLSVFFPVYLETQNLPIELFGIVYFFMNLIPMIGTYIYRKKLEKMNEYRIILTSLTIFSLGILLMGIFKNIYVGLFIYSFLRIVIGWFWLVFSIYLNSIATSANRATMFSIKGMVTNLAFILSDPFVSFVIYQRNIYYSYLLTGIFIIISTILLGTKHYLSKKGEKNIYLEK